MTTYEPMSKIAPIRTTNGLERLNQEIKRRTRVVRIFPNEQILPAPGYGTGGGTERGMDYGAALPGHGRVRRALPRREAGK